MLPHFHLSLYLAAPVPFPGGHEGNALLRGASFRDGATWHQDLGLGDRLVRPQPEGLRPEVADPHWPSELAHSLGQELTLLWL